MRLNELITALKAFQDGESEARAAVTIGETILKLSNEVKALSAEKLRLQFENRKITSALRSLAKKYSDNSSYFESALIENDAVYKKAVQALNKDWIKQK